MSKNNHGDDRISEVTELTEPLDLEFTERVMTGINLKTVVHDSIEGQWQSLSAMLSGFLDLILDMLRYVRKGE